MKKLKNDSGSAMILALFLMILVSIVMISFSNQVANQVKSTMNLNKDRQEMYDRESEIEEFIENFIKNIEVSINLYPDKEYVECGEYKVYYINTNVEVAPENQGDNAVKFGIAFKSNNEESNIEVRVSNIKDGDYDIDYAVKSWREQNAGVDSVNE